MELVDTIGMDLEIAQILIEAIDNGAVNLLLGAGASYGATGGDGKKLTGAIQLAKELNEHFKLGLDDDESSELATVYGDLANVPITKKSLNDFLAARFTNCRPNWNSSLHEFPWKRIWTLNIDDVITNSKPQNFKRALEHYTWKDPLQPRALKDGALQIIFLHGKADKLKADQDNLIFSLKEYMSLSENSPSWHAEFKSEWVKKPFLVCGAKLKEEYDLETVLSYGNYSSERGGCPSVIILRSITEPQIKRYKNRGLIPIAAEGELFFKALLADLLAWRKTNPPIDQISMAAREEVRASFRKLSHESPSPRKTLDFYASAETRWEHIVQKLDAPLSQVTHASQWIGETSEIGLSIILIFGGAVSGKSASALRIGANLVDQGFEAWHFRAEERFEEEHILNYSKSKKCAFIFDDCADFSSSLKELSTLAKEAGVCIKAIATCDKHRLRAVRADLAGAFVKEISIDPLSREDFLNIVRKRSFKGRLGSWSALSEKEAWKSFKSDYSGRLCLS